MSSFIRRIFKKNKHKHNSYNIGSYVQLVDSIKDADIENNKIFCRNMLNHKWAETPKNFMFFNLYSLEFLAGGYKTHMDLISYIYTKLKAKIYMCFVPDITSEQRIAFEEQLHKFYPDLHITILSIHDAHQITTDVCISLGIATVEAIKYQKCKEKYLHAMDDETLFFPSGSESTILNFLYSQGFFVFANSEALKEIYAQKNINTPVYHYIPGIDSRYCPTNKAKNNRTYKIIVYARPAVSRNAFSLIVPVIKRLKDEFGRKIKIELVGQDFDVGKYGLHGLCVNLGRLSSLDRLAEVYRESDIGISMITTPTFSYLHLQLMASGVCLVTNQQAGVKNFLFDKKNAVVVPPIPNIISSRIANLLNNPDQMRAIANNGNATVKDFTWDKCFSSIINFITKPKAN